MKALNSLPSNESQPYDSAYDQAIDRINAQSSDWKDLATRTLMILVCARQSLTMEELCDALSVDLESKDAHEGDRPDSIDVVSSCVGLVTFDKQSNTVRLVHKSAQDFFDRNINRLFLHAEATVAVICLTYTKARSQGYEEAEISSSQFLHKNQFYTYAYSNYWYHCQNADKQKNLVLETENTGLSVQAAQDVALLASQLGIEQFSNDLLAIKEPIIDACKRGMASLLEALLDMTRYDLTYGQNRWPSHTEYRCKKHD